VAYALAEDNEHTATCALCWNEDCGSLVISYQTAGERGSDLWDFVCLRCGLAVWACVLGSGGRTGFSVHSTGDAAKLSRIAHALPALG
jgi:hypothetical protein